MVETRTVALTRPAVSTPGHGCLATMLVTTVQTRTGKKKPTYELPSLEPIRRSAPPADPQPLTELHPHCPG